jgi:hypothetical protein
MPSRRFVLRRHGRASQLRCELQLFRGTDATLNFSFFSLARIDTRRRAQAQQAIEAPAEVGSIART